MNEKIIPFPVLGGNPHKLLNKPDRVPEVMANPRIESSTDLLREYKLEMTAQIESLVSGALSKDEVIKNCQYLMISYAEVAKTSN